VSFDPNAQRAATSEQWERSADVWRARRAELMRMSMPASEWMVDHIAPQPGQTVLELAAGVGDTGFLVAEQIAPGGGRLITSDRSEQMLDAARARAEELGLTNVEFRVLDAEWIDLETASVDAVLCRWGFMLMADPAAALRETRRVLRPGGRLALVAWGPPEHNVWNSAVTDELIARGLEPERDLDVPGMFHFSPAGRAEQLLAEAGFAEIEVGAVDLEQRYPDLDTWWETLTSMARGLGEKLDALPDDVRAEVRAEAGRRIEQFRRPDGEIVVPAQALAAAATA
jgi:SAM-dependent methyltransferase